MIPTTQFTGKKDKCGLDIRVGSIVKFWTHGPVGCEGIEYFYGIITEGVLDGQYTIRCTDGTAIQLDDFEILGLKLIIHNKIGCEGFDCKHNVNGECALEDIYMGDGKTWNGSDWVVE